MSLEMANYFWIGISLVLVGCVIVVVIAAIFDAPDDDSEPLPDWITRKADSLVFDVMESEGAWDDFEDPSSVHSRYAAQAEQYLVELRQDIKQELEVRNVG